MNPEELRRIAREIVEAHGIWNAVYDKDDAGVITTKAKAMDAVQDGYQRGYEAMREVAIKAAESEGSIPRSEGGSLSRTDACDNVAAAIRALPKVKE